MVPKSLKWQTFLTMGPCKAKQFTLNSRQSYDSMLARVLGKAQGRWTKPIFTWLTHATLDPDGSKRVTMDHLTRLVTSALRHSYEQGATDVTAQALTSTAELMTLRRDEIVAIERLPAPLPIAVQEVG